jgi:hypothetical protein
MIVDIIMGYTNEVNMPAYYYHQVSCLLQIQVQSYNHDLAVSCIHSCGCSALKHIDGYLKKIWMHDQTSGEYIAIAEG